MGKTAQRKRSAFELGVEHAKKTGRGFAHPRGRGPIHRSYIAGVKAGLSSLAPSYSPDYADDADYGAIAIDEGFNVGFWEWLKSLAMVTCLIIVALLLFGCSTINIATPDGYSASYTRIGDQEISGLRFEKDNLGLTRIVLDKQASKSDVLMQALRALVEGAK